MSGVLVPGWGAVPGLYSRGLPAGWEALELPRFGPSGGTLSAYRSWLGEELARRTEPVSLAGHSMGAALAILAALDQPSAVDRLILISPAGLPLAKPLRASLVTFLGQIVHGRYPTLELVRVVKGALRAPRAGLSLARTVHALDLTPEFERLNESSVSCIVVGCSTDELTTPDHCRRVAALIGAGYHEVNAPGGHIWMIAEPTLLTATLAKATRRHGLRGVSSRPSVAESSFVSASPMTA